MSSKLREYRQKRDFSQTPEPAGAEPDLQSKRHRFVVQKHDASNLHYDLRLEVEGVLRSWAIPREPLMEVGLRRLAVQTEDHPIEYLDFEGEIPAPGYGAGSMVIWDQGTWVPSDEHPARAIAMGRLDFTLRGSRLTGRWSLVRIGNRKLKTARKDNWLLIKRNDDKYRPGGNDRDAVDIDPAGLPGAVRADSFDDVGFQLATATNRAPDGDEWMHEPKLDGYRLLCHVSDKRATLITRNGHDWTDRFPRIAESVADMPCDSVVLDGEAVVYDAAGVTSFQQLQNAIAERSPSIIYVVFDVLFIDGWDLRNVSLMERKDLLRVLLAGLRSGVIRYGEHLVGHGPSFLEEACRLGLEGVVSKRTDGVYAAGRGENWLKAKCLQRQEFVIIGFTKHEGRRVGFGALLVGTRESQGEPLRYAGRVGTGFDQATLRSLRNRLDALQTNHQPVPGEIPGTRSGDITWVRPELVAEVEFGGWTESQVLRHPSFRGLREDKPADEVFRERSMPADHVKSKASLPRARLTNPDKLLWTEEKISKQHLADYWKAVAAVALPLIEQRPLTLLRCPEGIAGECFYQKHAGSGVPESVPRIDVGDGDPYTMVDDVPALIGLTQIGVIEIHTWGSRADRLDQPDQIVFDLDPGEGLAWGAVVDAVIDVRKRLEALGLVPFAKLTGGKGVHVVVPVQPGPRWPAIKKFAKALAEEMAGDEPSRYTSSLSKAKRTGKVFIDYLRNDREATAIAPYSPRARTGATVALPVEWTDLQPEGEGPPNVHLPEVVDHLRTRSRDPWADFDASRKSLV